MKRVMALFVLCCMLVMAFVACGNNDIATESGEPTGEQGNNSTEDPSKESEASKNEENKEENKEEPFLPILRFVAISDTHITVEGNQNYNKLTTLIQQMNDYANNCNDNYNRLDAILVAGDITDNGKVSEYEVAKGIFDDNMMDDTELVITMGNHDWNSLGSDSSSEFESVFGEGCALSMKKIGGYWFITISVDGNGWNYSENVVSRAEAMIQQAIADTGKDKPIFVSQHIGNINTLAGCCQHSFVKGVGSLNKMQSKYENLVVFSGHSHFPANDASSIYQDKFTAINTGAIYYSIANMNKGSMVEVPDRYDISQIHLVELDKDSRMRVRHWDYQQEKFVGDTWMVESYKREDFTYGKSRFSEDDIFFDETAELKIAAAYTNSAVITFPSVPKGSLAGRVYEITVTGEDNSISTTYLATEYFKDEFNKPLFAGIGGLKPKSKYTVEVRAVNSLYCTEVVTRDTLYSKPLTTTFTTASTAGSDVDIIDLSINLDDGTVSNSANDIIEPTVIGEPAIEYDSNIGKDVLVFDGSKENVVKFEGYTPVANTLKNAMTFEAYFKIDEIPTNDIATPISAQQNGGFGLIVYKNQNRCDFRMHDGAGYKTVGFDFETGVYYHVTITFDGRELVLYVDGVRQASSTLTAELYYPALSAQNIYLGGDTGQQGRCEYAAKCTVAGFRMYSYALTARQVAQAYQEMTEK